MIFGCGCEMAGITVSKTLAKWFEGHEWHLQWVLRWLSPASVSGLSSDFAPTDDLARRPDRGDACRILHGAAPDWSYKLYRFSLSWTRASTRKWQLKNLPNRSSGEEEFKIGDVGKILSSKLFWVIAMLCVLYYSAIFPFQRYATNMLPVQSQYGCSAGCRYIPLFPYRCCCSHSFPWLFPRS